MHSPGWPARPWARAGGGSGSWLVYLDLLLCVDEVLSCESQEDLVRLFLCEDNFLAKPFSRHFVLFCLLLFLESSFVEWKQVALPNAWILQHRVDEADSRSKQLLAARL